MRRATLEEPGTQAELDAEADRFTQEQKEILEDEQRPRAKEEKSRCPP
jgi:hypothetical protein